MASKLKFLPGVRVTKVWYVISYGPSGIGFPQIMPVRWQLEGRRDW